MFTQVKVVHIDGEVGSDIWFCKVHYDALGKAFLCRPLASTVHLEVGTVPCGALCHYPHLYSPLDGFQREVLVETQSPLELHH